MSFIYDNIEPGELITYQARVHPLAYLVPLVLIVTMMTPGKLTAMLTTELAFTSKRVVGRVGMFRRRQITWPHARVDMVRVNKGVFGGLFNYGTITFTSKDGTKVKFYGIARPLEVQQRAEEFIEMALLGRVLPREGALDPLPLVPKPRMEVTLPPQPKVETPPPPPQPPERQPKTFGRKRPDDTVW